MAFQAEDTETTTFLLQARKKRIISAKNAKSLEKLPLCLRELCERSLLIAQKIGDRTVELRERGILGKSEHTEILIQLFPFLPLFRVFRSLKNVVLDLSGNNLYNCTKLIAASPPKFRRSTAYTWGSFPLKSKKVISSCFQYSSVPLESCFCRFFTKSRIVSTTKSIIFSVRPG